MWLLVELLPGLVSTWQKLKNKQNNPMHSFAFILLLLGLMVSIFYIQNILLTLVILTVYIFYRFIAFAKYHDRLYANYDTKDFVLLDSISLRECKERHGYTYTELFQIVQKRWTSQPMPFIEIIFKPEVGSTYLLINGHKIMSKPLSHFKIIFFGIVYSQTIKDSQGKRWSLKIRFWGVLRPSITLIIKNIE